MCPTGINTVAEEYGKYAMERYGCYTYNGYYANNLSQNDPVDLRRITAPSICAFMSDGSCGSNLMNGDGRFLHSKRNPAGSANYAFFDGHVKSLRRPDVPLLNTDVFFRGVK
jgi:prepilin-type processing-associated H-X9-DG protein